MDVGAIDALADSTLAAGRRIDVYLIDEIGKMECLSRRFVEAMRRVLASTKPVVATVGQRGGGFIAEVKRRDDVTVWTVSQANRDELPARVVAWLDAA